jgi:hypothetical protein
MHTTQVIILCLFVYFCSAQTFVGPAWQQQSANAKRSVLDPTVQNDTTPGNFPNALELAELFIEDMNLSFDTYGDDMPDQFLQRRPKLIHSVGVVADGVWKPVANNLGYTGVFQGCDNLYIRLSLAKTPETGAQGYTPGLSLKCLRNGVHSGNIFAMFSLQGQDSWNFFKNDLTNHVPDLSNNANFLLKQLRSTFAKASAWPVMIGLSDLALYDQQGNNITSPNFPFRLIFHPVTAIHNAFPDAPSQPFYDILVSGLSNPGPLYEVYAIVNPGDSNSAAVHIATISTTSPAETSKFGDAYMFFQHTRMEEDFTYIPDWADPATQIMANQRTIDYYTFPNLPWN